MRWVTGHVPFEGDNTVTVALAHLEEPMPDPRMLNPDVSPSLARIILKCTEKRPERRYPNAAAVISDLRRALLNDDDPTIGAVKEEDHSSDTIVISPKELNLIKTRSGERIRESKPVKRSVSAGNGGIWKSGMIRRTTRRRNRKRIKWMMKPQDWKRS